MHSATLTFLPALFKMASERLGENRMRGRSPVLGLTACSEPAFNRSHAHANPRRNPTRRQARSSQVKDFTKVFTALVSPRLAQAVKLRGHCSQLVPPRGPASAERSRDARRLGRNAFVSTLPRICFCPAAFGVQINQTLFDDFQPENNVVAGANLCRAIRV